MKNKRTRAGHVPATGPLCEGSKNITDPLRETPIEASGIARYRVLLHNKLRNQRTTREREREKERKSERGCKR